MIEKLRLERFKNFQDAELILGPFTLLVGSNGVHLTLAWAKHLDSTFVFLCHRLSPKCFAPT